MPAEDSGASSESEAPAAPRTLPSVLDAAASLTGVESASVDLLLPRTAPEEGRLKRQKCRKSFP